MLREALLETDKVALANVVVRTRQRLAVVMPKDSSRSSDKADKSDTTEAEAQKPAKRSSK